MDASTLGKIEVVGPDAAEFLNRLYINSFTKLGVGRCRYGLMLNEMGFVYDDGVVMRLAEDRFHITTTTSGAAHVFAVMEDYRQTEWPELKVHFTSITEQWATIAINGPQAREILAPLVEGIDMSSARLPAYERARGPHSRASRRGSRASASPARWASRSTCPRDYGLAVQEAIWAEAREARRLRLRPRRAADAARRKGLHRRRPGDRRHGDARRSRHGQDGRDVEAGFHRQALAEPARSEARRAASNSSACCPRIPTIAPDEGAQIVAEDAPAQGTPALGHVTSSYMSPTLGRSFAMALVADGRAKIGQTVYADRHRGRAAGEDRRAGVLRQGGPAP